MVKVETQPPQRPRRIAESEDRSITYNVSRGRWRRWLPVSQNEIPEGPGIFTGAFEGAGDDGTPSDVEAATVSDFKAYQRWKSDPRNASEYQEFIEWRIWNAQCLRDKSAQSP